MAPCRSRRAWPVNGRTTDRNTEGKRRRSHSVPCHASNSHQMCAADAPPQPTRCTATTSARLHIKETHMKRLKNLPGGIWRKRQPLRQSNLRLACIPAPIEDGQPQEVSKEGPSTSRPEQSIIQIRQSKDNNRDRFVQHLTLCGTL